MKGGASLLLMCVPVEQLRWFRGGKFEENFEILAIQYNSLQKTTRLLAVKFDGNAWYFTNAPH